MILALTALSLSIGCGLGYKDPMDVAVLTALEWAEDNLEEIASDLGGRLIDELPATANVTASDLEDQLRHKLGWNVPPPVETSVYRWDVVVKARATIDVTGSTSSEKAYDVSLDYRLEVDTRRESVVSFQLDEASLSVKEQ